MRVAFVLNPAARSGRAARLGPEVLAAARAAGLDASLHVTERPRHAEALALELATSHDAVVAVGGDGTVSEVAAGLAGLGTPLGIVPFGTGNDLASALGVPGEIDQAVALVADGEARALDLLRAEWTEPDGSRGQRTAANAVGIGFDAAAAAGAARYKRLGGVAAYLASVLRTLGAWRRPERGARIRADGETLHDGPLFLCEIGNGPRVGGGFVLTPGADPGDGVADLCIVDHVSTGRALTLLPRALRGSHVGQPEVRTAQALAVTVEATGRPLPVHGDGEALSAGVRTLRVGVWPGALRVIAPARAGGAPVAAPARAGKAASGTARA